MITSKEIAVTHPLGSKKLLVIRVNDGTDNSEEPYVSIDLNSDGKMLGTIILLDGKAELYRSDTHPLKTGTAISGWMEGLEALLGPGTEPLHHIFLKEFAGI